MRRLYHKKVYWENDFDTLAKELFNTNYSTHLWEILLFKGEKGVAAKDLDRIITEIMDCKRNYYLYEVETVGYNQLIKAVIRTSFDIHNDINLVFAKDREGKLFVRTAWLNSKTDFHTTLDKSRYYTKKVVIPPKN